MIKSVTITNYLGEQVHIVLNEDNPDHGFLIEEIKGLGPPKANISTTSLATGDGSVFNFAKLQQRNIVFEIIFTPAPDIETTRQRSYQFFPMKKPLEILIEEDNRVLSCTGHVESNNPDIFDKQETTQISIICTDCYLYDVGMEETIFSGIENMFEFPFSNELEEKEDFFIVDNFGNLVVDENGISINGYALEDRNIIFGNIERAAQKTVIYEGDADVGVTITMHAIGIVEDITIYDVITRERMHIDTEKIEALTGEGVHTGDTIVITTMRKNRTITLIRGGKEYNILNSLDRGSPWFQLRKGVNKFAYICEVGGSNLEFKITNQILYEGI